MLTASINVGRPAPTDGFIGVAPALSITGSQVRGLVLTRRNAVCANHPVIYTVIGGVIDADIS